MSIIQRHIPSWDTAEARAIDRKVSNAEAVRRQAYTEIYRAAQLLATLPGSERNARDFYEYGRDLVDDMIRPEAIEHVDSKAISEEVWVEEEASRKRGVELKAVIFDMFKPGSTQ